MHGQLEPSKESTTAHSNKKLKNMFYKKKCLVKKKVFLILLEMETIISTSLNGKLLFRKIFYRKFKNSLKPLKNVLWMKTKSTPSKLSLSKLQSTYRKLTVVNVGQQGKSFFAGFALIPPVLSLCLIKGYVKRLSSKLILVIRFLI